MAPTDPKDHPRHRVPDELSSAAGDLWLSTEQPASPPAPEQGSVRPFADEA